MRNPDNVHIIPTETMIIHDFSLTPYHNTGPKIMVKAEDWLLYVEARSIVIEFERRLKKKYKHLL